MKKIYRVKFNQFIVPELAGTLTVILRASSIVADLHSEFISYCKANGFTVKDGEFITVPEIISIKLIAKIENA